MTARTRIDAKLIGDVGERVAANRPVRRTLPDGGRIHIDRQLPFLVLHRLPEGADRPAADQFVRGEAAYLVAPPGRAHQKQVTALVERVAAEMVEVFGGFLIIEVWSGPHTTPDEGEEELPPRPTFRVVVPRADVDEPSVAQLVTGLERIKVLRRPAVVSVAPGGRLSPPGMTRISRGFGTAGSPVRLIGVEVAPIHREVTTGAEFPGVTQSLHRQLSVAFQRAVFQFALHQTTHRPRHYQALGRRAIVRAVTRVDAQLAAIASAFDLLLLVSPVNADREYRAFRRRKGSRSPSFLYRPVDVDVARLKRELYTAAIDRVEDPTLASIFRDKQRELSLKLDLLTDRTTPRFLHTGVTLYGDVAPEMVAEASVILEHLQPDAGRRSGRSVGADVFARAAQREIDRYREDFPELGATVQLRPDTTSLVVSNGHLIVGSAMRFPATRVEALIQHEVGTHVTTYWNGASQRLKLLATGLAGHDELQEGFAVLAEYLVAGLTPARLRTVAARVVAARSVLDGAEFLDTYRMLTDTFGFAARPAFLTTMRVHRGGGFVKDAVYLRGLKQVVDYLAEGGRLDTLLVGKIAVEHVAVIEELQRRKLLTPPQLRPAYLDEPDTHYRLERLRQGIDLVALVDGVDAARE